MTRRYFLAVNFDVISVVWSFLNGLTKLEQHCLGYFTLDFLHSLIINHNLDVNMMVLALYVVMEIMLCKV